MRHLMPASGQSAAVNVTKLINKASTMKALKALGVMAAVMTGFSLAISAAAIGLTSVAVMTTQ